MRRLRDLSWRGGMFWLAVFALLLAVGLGLFAASGVYNVAASVPHFFVVDRLIKFALRRSVATHSTGIEVPDLSDDDLVRLGALHFSLGCAPCHGSPAAAAGPIAAALLPAPPPLRHAAEDWDTEELFWIVRNGFKFTGMPAWPGIGRDDEVWALVAFIERLPEIDRGEFAALTGGSGGVEGKSPVFDFGERPVAGLTLCAACHGEGDSPPVSRHVPALQGQSADYLRRSMLEYREGLRQSGIMEPVAAALDDAAIEQLVARYAGSQAVPRSGMNRDKADIDRGREIAESGVARGQIPACLSCHSATASSRFPRLAGLSKTYIRAQLTLFRHGVRDRTAYGAIMSTIARRLSDEQIEAAAAYFEQADPGDSSVLSAQDTEPADR